MTRAHFARIDILLLAAYFGFTLVVGFWKRRRSTEDYLIASRTLSLPVFVATLVATWYGGILAVGEFTYQFGLANWTTQGLPYYLFAILFALILAPRVRSASLYTIPDKLADAYGRPAALLGAAYAFVMVTPAPYLLMVGQLVAVAFGWPLPAAMLVGTLFSVAYVYVGGFQSDVRINVFQFCLMFGGFAVALATLLTHFGGFGWMAQHLPPTHLQLSGGQDAGYILVWFFIALWTLVDPGFHQRCYAARDGRTARNGILVAVVCWAVFDFMTTSTGLFARAAMPNLPVEQQGLAFPLLAERFLPPGVKGLFYVAMLATVMSTVVSYTFLAAMTIGRDFWWRLRGEKQNAEIPRYTQVGLILTTLAGWVVALAVPSVVKQWFAIGSIFVPGLLLPLLTAYYPRLAIRPSATFAAMFTATLSAAICLAIGWLRHGIYADTKDFPFHTQPMYAGLVVSGAIYLLSHAARVSRTSRVVAGTPT
jgi:SSS family solute:Na+ symporter